ncbi:sigma-70 family RNA polymerase sigma factor [Nocardia cyriacigeorgica]|nr:sigma-70 family RNA polymerase sigma factor [Nocardia cyriacigeorgica]
MAVHVLHSAGMADHADDVIQGVFESLVRSQPTGVRNWEAYLITSVRNKARDLLGSAAIRHAGPSFDAQLHDDVDRSTDLADGVVEAADRSETAARAWDALAVLNTQQRQVFYQYRVLGRERAEVARELGVSPGRVSQIAMAAAELLKEAMNREQVADG